MSVGIPIPQYQCHKKVWALKIESVRHNSDGTATIHPVDRDYARFDVPAEYREKHDPEAGGYYVVYDDGYKSFSPAAAFEAGYTRI